MLTRTILGSLAKKLCGNCCDLPSWISAIFSFGTMVTIQLTYANHLLSSLAAHHVFLQRHLTSPLISNGGCVQQYLYSANMISTLQTCRKTRTLLQRACNLNRQGTNPRNGMDGM
ncbi:peroxisomal N(1)-acetyl-spermine/spermidine oxidase [Platysternon megacephalum]|uniref:Peroxisomal N(1)-acetyl-spermine/spermidine oxidase n=1 Tax=Platysternon megacephalum TaxID=55544 RepID=A0A4D9ECT9_9SAUR|nr:peroxisomal N(1)-acetyl-spermine/spermidine oxidase [Platysternon megacephalum]